jgi:hypothetical protein
VTTPAREPIELQLNKTFETLPDIVMGAAPPYCTLLWLRPPRLPPRHRSWSRSRLVASTTSVDATRRTNIDQRLIEILPLANIRSFDDLRHARGRVVPPPEVKGVAGPVWGPGSVHPGSFR